jgi:hypothetical protein
MRAGGERAGWILALLLVLTACGGRIGGGTPTPPPQLATPSASLPAPAGHVFVIVMENRSYRQALAEPFTAHLAGEYAVADNDHAVAHPSLPNYLALTAGTTFGITDDDYHRLPQTGIGWQLTRRGISWRAYMESMTRGCFDSPYPYALKHDPFAYYGGACPPNVVPLTRLPADLAQNTPRFVWITPNLCHDGHDCSSRVADDFLAGIVPQILASPAWRQGGVLFITWDESSESGGGNRVATIVAAPDLARHLTDRYHDHYSLLATVEGRLGLPLLGEAAHAQPFDELFR